MAPHAAVPVDIDPQQANEFLQEGALMVDVREPWELVELRVPGALHIPLMQLPARSAELPRDRTLVFLCRSGARSHTAARILLAAGHADAMNLQGGILAWHHAGLPTKSGPLEDDDGQQ
jgi:rhodanese-related sulfurtransferase